jgi:hypothetical protein
MSDVAAVVLGIALQSPVLPFTLCFNDSCVDYQCDTPPSVSLCGEIARVHTPCLPLNLVCKDQGYAETCTVNGITVTQMPNKQGVILGANGTTGNCIDIAQTGDKHEIKLETGT